MSSRYNPYNNQLFKLEVRPDTSENGPLVRDTRKALHENEAVADGQGTSNDESEKKDE